MLHWTHAKGNVPTSRLSLGCNVSTRSALTALYGLGLALSLTALSACGGGGSTAKDVGPAAGGDTNNTPKAGLTLKGISWGRLVDIRSADNTGAGVPITKVVNGATVTDSFYLDQLITENIGLSKTLTTTTTPPVQLTLQNDIVTGTSVLVIGATFDPSPKSLFQRAYAEVTSGLGSVAIAGPSSVPPYSQVPRDASIRLAFDRPVSQSSITPDTVRVYVGASASSGQLPPDTFQGRFIFKPESPKDITIDPTVTALDDARIDESVAAGIKMNPQALPLNSQGFPASISTATFNIAVFVPSRYDLAKGVTKILLGKDGTALNANGSVTKFSSTTTGEGVVRVFRAGGAASDANQGFLADPTPPKIIGSQPISIDQIISPDQRTIKMTFTNAACDLSVRVGDSIQQGGAGATRFATVVSVDSSTVGDGDHSYNVTVNYLQASTFNIVDAALITTTYDEASQSALAPCFTIVTPLPAPLTVPLTNVDPNTTFTVRFSKPMNSTKINPIENFCVIMDPVAPSDKTPSGATTGPFDIAVGTVTATPDLRAFKYTPVLPFRNDGPTAPQTANYLFYVIGGSSGVTDLVGNPLQVTDFGFKVKFKVNPNAPINSSRGLTLRFDTLFEGTGPAQLVSGQVTQSKPGTIGPRPPTTFSRYADSSNTFVNAMKLFTTAGVQTPLSNLGSRLMTVYRHIDLNLVINSIGDTDLDVVGMAWTPFGGVIQNDFFNRIRIDLSHSKWFPDEAVDINLLPIFVSSGLTTSSFLANIHEAADHPEKRTYDGQYTINPNAAVLAPAGETLLAYPTMLQTYTWRDSSFGAGKFGGSGGFGVNPQQYYTLLPFLTPPTSANNLVPDHPYRPGAVPSVGLPLLADFRIYPASDSNTKGLNGYQVSVAVNSSSKPNFRVFSTGGLDQNGVAQTVTPDVSPLGTVPSGGYFPPGSTQGPPGTKTPADGPEVYPGRVDFAVRVSRVYTHFYNLQSTGVNSPIFNSSWIVAVPQTQPSNTTATVEFCGADTVTGGSLTDARCFDVYGQFYGPTGTEVVNGVTIYPTVPQPAVSTLACGTVTGQVPNPKPALGQGTPSSVNFTPTISTLNAKRFLQMRFTFESDIVNNVAPSLSAVGVGFTAP